MSDLEYLQSLGLTDLQTDVLFDATQWCDQVWRTEKFGYAKDLPTTEMLADRFRDERYLKLLKQTLVEQEAPTAIVNLIDQLMVTASM